MVPAEVCPIPQAGGAGACVIFVAERHLASLGGLATSSPGLPLTGEAPACLWGLDAVGAAAAGEGPPPSSSARATRSSAESAATSRCCSARIALATAGRLIAAEGCDVRRVGRAPLAARSKMPISLHFSGSWTSACAMFTFVEVSYKASLVQEARQRWAATR